MTANINDNQKVTSSFKENLLDNLKHIMEGQSTLLDYIRKSEQWVIIYMEIPCLPKAYNAFIKFQTTTYLISQNMITVVKSRRV